MKEEELRSEEDKQRLMLWATACKTLTARMLGGLDALFIAATQGTNTALPAAMITDSEVRVRCAVHVIFVRSSAHVCCIFVMWRHESAVLWGCASLIGHGGVWRGDVGLRADSCRPGI